MKTTCIRISNQTNHVIKPLVLFPAIQNKLYDTLPQVYYIMIPWLNSILWNGKFIFTKKEEDNH